ncbi:hypothetical protein [Prosthecochloris aestuarii]|uniref:hypothetical protein n=1 Tax=Prosthecochloris aestuarii TaxID=1102 RepID=UPI0000541B7E|nr:hypothetical protein [Prosthecochloris aestuarii]
MTYSSLVEFKLFFYNQVVRFFGLTSGAREVKKRSWGSLTASWVPHDIRDAGIDFVQYWTGKSGIAVTRFIQWLGIATSKYYSWQNRYGKVNEHNGLIPRDFWLEEWEKQAIINFHTQYPLEGYRRLTYMMLVRILLP